MWNVANFLLVRPRTCYFRHIHPPYKETQPFFFFLVFFFWNPVFLEQVTVLCLNIWFILTSCAAWILYRSFITFWLGHQQVYSQPRETRLVCEHGLTAYILCILFASGFILFYSNFIFLFSLISSLFFFFGSLHTYFSRQPQNHFRMSLEQTIKSS